MKEQGFYYEIGQIIPTTKGSLKVIDLFRKKQNGKIEKYIKYKCCEDGYTNIILETNIRKGTNCPVCAHSYCVPGWNDVYTLFPEKVKYFWEASDAKKVTEHSNKKIDWKCQECGKQIPQKRVFYMLNKPPLCEECSQYSAMSQPERIMASLLKELNLLFQYNQSFLWSKNKKYDFYIPSHNMIIEMHGKQHYCETSFTSRSLEEEQSNDEMKEQLAKKHGIDIYIIIDSSNSDFGFIQQKIINSELKDRIDFSRVDWNEVECNARKSLIEESSKLWEELHNVRLIAEEMNISRNIVHNYLKIGYKKGLNEYCSSEVNIQLYKNHVTCLNTGETFYSRKQAEERFGINLCNIHLCCMGKAQYCGKYNGEKLVWRKTEQYKNMSKEDINKLINNANQPRKTQKYIVCINTKEIFGRGEYSRACDKYNTTKQYITKCCKGIIQFAGTDPITQERVRWAYCDENGDYDEIQFHTKRTQKVRCVTNSIIFNSIKKAALYANVHPSGITKCCTGQQKTAGKDKNGNKLQWEYLNE